MKGILLPLMPLFTMPISANNNGTSMTLSDDLRTGVNNAKLRSRCAMNNTANSTAGGGVMTLVA